MPYQRDRPHPALWSKSTSILSLASSGLLPVWHGSLCAPSDDPWAEHSGARKRNPLRSDPRRAERGSRRRSMLRTGARLGSAEGSAPGRPSRGRRHWRSRLLHDNADLAQSRSSRARLEALQFPRERPAGSGWSASPSASPSAVVISAVVGNRERQVDDGPPAVEQHVHAPH
jgi:hypothetical protein